MPQFSTKARRRPWLVGSILAISLAVGFASPAGAQDAPDDSVTTVVDGGGDEATTTTLAEDEAGIATGVQGTLIAGQDKGGVAGVTISALAPDGSDAGSTETDEDGTWFLPLPAADGYEVMLDPSTLPEGIALRAPDRNPLTLDVQGGNPRAALFGLEVGEGATDRTAADAREVSTFTDDVAARLVDGIVFGLILAVAAIGLSLVFGTTKLVNFAHGELVAFGAITAWFLSSEGPMLPVIAAGLVAVVAGAMLGGVQEVGLWRPLRKRSTGQFQVLVISIGLSIAARQALLVWFGTGARRYRQYVIQRDSWSLGPFEINARDATLVVVCIAVLVGVAFILQRTKIGKAMRAVSDNPDLAASSGINVQRVILFVWMLGGALAAGGGVLQGVAARVEYLMGFELLLLMFAGVILGGLGTAYGAMVGGLVVGLTTELSTLWISSELKTVAALSILIVVLLFRPQGLLGQRERVG